MSVTETTSAPVGTIFLRPRPYVHGSGVLVLLPLISESPRRPQPTLPAETWFRVLSFIFTAPPSSIAAEERNARLSLMRVSKTFKNLVSPLLYSAPHLPSLPPLESFTRVLHASDKAWDSLRRIPYSTPGRWVQVLDLSRISCTTPAEYLAVDTLLTSLFPLTPFLSQIVLNSTVKLSRRAITALASRDEIGCLKVLKGIKWGGEPRYYEPREDPLLLLVRAAEGLQELEVFGPGLGEDDDDDPQVSRLITPPPTPLPPLFLPNLHSLKILSLPNGPLIDSLVRSPLPALRNLMITPYDDVPSAQTTALVTAHGTNLIALAFHTPKTWPPIRHTTPSGLLHSSPALQALSLTQPLPQLTVPLSPHPIRVLSLPRPDSACLWKLEAWLCLGRLPKFQEVHMRDTRWIRPGVSQRAAEAGVQGEMGEWKRRLGRWRVRVLDANGREHAS